MWRAYCGKRLDSEGRTVVDGAIDCLLLCAFLRQSLLPPNLPGLATPCPQRLPAPATTLPFDPATYILKLSTGMGGRNTVVAFGLPTL